MKKVKLDKYEKEIEKNAGKFKKVSKSKKKKIEKIIENVNKKRRITLRLNIQDIELLKSKADEEGLPYQTFISSILHKYITNKLVDEKNIIKTIKLMKS